MQVTDDDKAVLDFERSWWKYAGAKERAIRETFDVAVTWHHQRLNALINLDDALATTRCWSAGCAASGTPARDSGRRAASNSRPDVEQASTPLRYDSRRRDD